ncbi:MAG: metal ABC transporter permease [Synechococcales cyanobacterium]
MLAHSLAALGELLAYPFMQRALLGGIVVGGLGGLLGSLTVVRQLSFFSHTVSHAALLGMVISAFTPWDPTWVLLPFTVMFGVGVVLLMRLTQLWSDTILNIAFSGALAVAIIGLSLSPGYRASLTTYLFGDILAIRSHDLWLSLGVLVVAIGLLGITLRSQMLMVLHEGMARAQGIPVLAHQLGFVVLLSLVVAVAIKAVGVLLVNAFLVIPAASARLVSRRFERFIGRAMVLGGVTAVLGILLSGLTNWPSGPSIVVVQLLCFALCIGVSGLTRSGVGQD